MDALTAAAKKPAHYQSAGPGLLANEPASIPVGDNLHPLDGWSELKSHLELTLVALRTWRQSWWTENWSDLAMFILPRRSTWLTQSTGGTPSPNNMTRGRAINTAIVDPKATYAARVCSAGLMSGLASPSRPWFRILPSMRKMELDAEALQWIDDTQDRIYTVLARSNFYNSFAQECEDNVVFGTAPTIIYEDEDDIIRLYNPVVGEYFLQNGSTNRVNGLYRQFVMTVQQIVDFFGVEQCPAEVQRMWNEKGNQLQVELLVAHSIEPNYGIGPKNIGKIPGNFTWREVYWLWGRSDEKPLSIAGFKDCPFTAARWSTQSNDAYGRSPGMDVLPDVMQLQVMTRRMAEAIEKQVRPPLVADMSMKNQPSSTLPGHVTYVDQLGANTGMRPIYEVNPDVNAMSANIAAIQNRIAVGLFNDLFLMLESAPLGKMTAYEVAQKMQEKLAVLGPVIENLLSESLKPKLKRIFAIMERKGLIEPRPASLQSVPLDIDFVSILAMAQKAAATGGIERLMSFVGSAAPLFPAALDNLNIDETIREYNELLGNPEKIMFAPEQVAARRQVNAQQQAQQQKMAAVTQMAQAAGAAAPAGQVLQNLDVGGGQNALGALMGVGGRQ